MRITSLTLTNFRNYRHLELTLPPHLTVVCGDNAQGKTNLLEAIYVLATTKSHRASSDRDLIYYLASQENPAIGRLFAQVQRVRGDLKLEIVLRLERTDLIDGEGIGSVASHVAVRKRLRFNGIAKRAADVVGQVNVVMFTAEDIDLVAGIPALGRRYLDLVNCQTDSRYLRCLQRYNRVLLQRNHLLRLLQERQAKPEQLEFWDEELVQNGSYIMVQRQRLVTELGAIAQGVYQGLSSGTERLDPVYVCRLGMKPGDADIAPQFHGALNRSRSKEVAQGMTLVGPHRDGLQFQLDGIDMGKYGSRGQQRTIVLALKLAEAKYMQARVGDAPILLLDDVFADLDRARRQHLLESVVSFQQVLITATDLDYFEPSFLLQADRLQVREGNVVQA